MNYHIENGQLQANNHIFLDQLTLGDKVDSPDALSIPLTLALMYALAQYKSVAWIAILISSDGDPLPPDPIEDAPSR